MIASLKYTTGPITRADAGGLDAVISTPRVDSDGESVDPLGITNRAEWLTNPLVYWAHEWAMDPTAEPVGKGTRLDVSREAITSSAVYAPTPKAQNVRALVVGGFVRKTSIGFDPLEVRLVGGIPTHTKWALREWSIVPMPANTDATITGVKTALRWFADQIAEPEETPVGIEGGLDPSALLELVTDNGLSMHNDGRTVVLSDEVGRRIARIRPKRVATLAPDFSTFPDSAFAAIHSAKDRRYPHHRVDGTVDRARVAAALRALTPDDLGYRHLRAHAEAEGLL